MKKIKRSHLLPALAILAIFPLLMMFSACDSSTSPKTGTLSGRVVLVNDTENPELDPVDFSGVKVVLYEQSETDTTLVRLNTIYSDMGTEYGSNTNFDHRYAKRVLETETAANGEFELSSIQPGNYNLVLISERWSYRYIYDCHVAADQELDLGQVDLYPIRFIASSIHEEFVFQTNHTYVFEYDTTIVPNVTIESEATLLVSEGCTLRFYGDVNCPVSGKWRVDSIHGFLSTESVIVDPDEYFSGINLYGEGKEIRNLTIQHGANTIWTTASNTVLSDCFIGNSGNGLSCNNTNIVLDNVTFYKISGMATQVVGLEEECIITKCIYLDCYNGISVYTLGDTTVSGCYFVRNHYAIKTASSHGNISHSDFLDNYYHIFMERSSFVVSYNNFFFCRYISVYPGSIGTNDQSIVNNNNFFETEYMFISLRAGAPSYTNVIEDLDAKNNYWGVVDIDEFLLDENDNEDYPNPCRWEVTYTPKSNSIIQEAGIQTEGR
jgi:hypothetical protein